MRPTTPKLCFSKTSKSMAVEEALLPQILVSARLETLSIESEIPSTLFLGFAIILTPLPLIRICTLQALVDLAVKAAEMWLP